jgi:hypothetical protein
MGTLEVGCVCAQKLTGEIHGPAQAEARLRNRAAMRSRWLSRVWKRSSVGNDYLNIDGHNIGVSRNRNGLWQFRFDGTFFHTTFSNSDQAKLALFDYYWDHTNH